MRGCCCVWLCRQTQPFVHLAGKPGEQLTSFYGDVEGCRRAFAALIGAAQDDIALVPSTSYGMATAAKNLLPPGYLSRGDRLLVLEQQFQSNYYVWEEAAYTCGAELLVVERPPDFDWTAAVLGALSGADGRHVRLVSLPTVHWTDGTVVDLERIGVRCRELGCALVVDGTQSIGAAPLDVAKVQPDFLTASAYKWLLCPYGLAFLYASPRQQQSGQPLEFHNWERHGEGFYQYQYNAGARRFDAGQRSNSSRCLPVWSAWVCCESGGPTASQPTYGRCWSRRTHALEPSASRCRHSSSAPHTCWGCGCLRLGWVAQACSNWLPRCWNAASTSPFGALRSEWHRMSGIPLPIFTDCSTCCRNCCRHLRPRANCENKQ
eukprot:COSAG01_NODE_10112_length_2248_cov_25.796184_2_plen_377_part_00